MKYDSISTARLQPWSVLNDVRLHGVEICPDIVTADGISKGGGLLSTAQHESEDVLLSISQDLILSRHAVDQCAKTDKYLRELTEALSDFIQTPRKATVLFLLYQMTIASPDLAHLKLGVQSPFTDYVRSLPKEVPLPTFYSDEQRQALIGTSLSEALDQKMASLEREFELLRDQTESIGWCRQAWWDEHTGRLSFDDWLLADALYRSRALELPGLEDSMVPVLDMANHSADDRYNARFDVSREGRVLLLVREGKTIQEGEEVTITYGRGGASEMIFSYGFLEENVQSAREMFLSLTTPEDDPLRIVKLHYAKEAPGVRVFLNAQGQVDWDSNFVWWICVNEEDGLDFQVLQTTNGERELQATWQGDRLQHDGLRSTLMTDPRRDIFMLRATVTIQEKVEQQGEELSAGRASADDNIETATHDSQQQAKFVHQTIQHLRRLELELLMASFEALDSEKQRLLSSRSVAEYLAATAQTSHPSEGQQEEDFS